MWCRRNCSLRPLHTHTHTHTRTHTYCLSLPVLLSTVCSWYNPPFSCHFLLNDCRDSTLLDQTRLRPASECWRLIAQSLGIWSSVMIRWQITYIVILICSQHSFQVSYFFCLHIFWFVKLIWCYMLHNYYNLIGLSLIQWLILLQLLFSGFEFLTLQVVLLKFAWYEWGWLSGRARDSWSKGLGTEFHGQLSVLIIISVSVPPLCYHSST